MALMVRSGCTKPGMPKPVFVCPWALGLCHIAWRQASAIASSEEPSRSRSIRSVSVWENKQERIFASAVIRVREHSEQKGSVTEAIMPTVPNSRPLEGSVTLKSRSEEHTSELQSRFDLVCRLLLEKKKGR